MGCITNISERRKAIEILVVDDNPGDVHLLSILFQEAKNPNHVHVVQSGRDALMFMRRAGPYRGAPAPNLVLLDIKMPEMSGIDVLKEMRKDPRLSSIPVIVLSSSDDENDVSRCYELHANCYLIKPMDLEELDRMVASIDDFWLSSVRFPAIRNARETSSDYS